MPSLVPVSIEGEHVGDLINGPHGVTFFSSRPELSEFDGRSFVTIQDARSTLRIALWGKPGVLEGLSREPSRLVRS